MRKIYAFLLCAFGATNLSAQVNVTATGGTTSASYATLGAAFSNINSGTHTGVITLNIASSTTETGPCVLHSSGAGSSSYSSVTIRPSADGVTISGPTTTGRGLIELNGADNVTIDGDNPGTSGINRNLTFTNTAATTVTYAAVIRIATSSSVTSADNNTIKNCIINGSSIGGNASGTTSATSAFATSWGIYAGGNGGSSATTDPSTLTSTTTNTAASGQTITNLIIDNNQINTCGRGVAFMGGATSVSSALTITNNTIGSSTAVTGNQPYTSPTSTVYVKGIVVYGTNAVTVTGNVIQDIISYIADIRSGIELNNNIGSGTINIANNTITNIAVNSTSAQRAVGIYVINAAGPYTITGNTITNMQNAAASSTSPAEGIEVNTSAASGLIEKNKITRAYNNATGAYTSNGIWLNGGSNITVQNNFISDINVYSNNSVTSTSFLPSGIKIASGTGHKIYHNTIHFFGGQLGGTSSNGTACLTIVSSSSTGMDVRNNIFSNQFSGWPSGTIHACILMPSGQTSSFNFTCNNNAYFVPAANYVAQLSSGTTYTPANFNATSTSPATNFRAYSSVLNSGGTNDNASVAFTSAPPFVSSSDLHIPAGTSSSLESGAASVGVTADIDNQSRPGPAGSTYGGGVIPDIGADEFDGVPIDVTAPSIVYTPLTLATCATGDRTLTGVTISDASGVPTSGLLMPRIYFRKNAGTWNSSAGTLTSGTATSGTWSFTVTAATMGGLVATDVVSYYIIAQDVAGTPNIGANPGAGLVASNVNSVTTHPTTPNTFTIGGSLGGTYTVGAGGAYTTLTAAVNAYNAACLTSAVTFVLTDASYSTAETFPILINNNSYASATNTLTIKPATGMATTITSGSSSAAVFKLLNAKYIIIDGLNTGGSSLALVNGNTGSNTADVWLASSTAAGSGNSNISLLNMDITGGATSVSNWGIVAVVDGTTPAGTNGMDNDNITIQGNTIKKVGYAIYAAGVPTTGTLSNWVVKNNIFGPAAYSATDNIGYNGMFMRYMNNPLISGNTMRNIGFNVSWTSQTVGIYMENGVDGAVIDSNIINTVQGTGSNSGTSSICGIYLGTSVINTTISRNRISAIYNLSTNGYSSRGIIVNTGTTTSNATIVNNFIWDIACLGDAGVLYWPVGISIHACGGINVYNNSINLYGTHAGYNSATRSACLFVTGGAASVMNLDIRNNLFVNTYDNTTVTNDLAYSIFSESANTAFSNIDYNDYYVSGAPGVLANIGGTDRPTLTDIVSGFGGNTYSINYAPLFTSADDLHLQAVGANVPLIAGVSIAAVTNDIDGTTRGTTPVIGADEVSIPPCSGTPAPGTVVASALSGCGTFGSNLSLTGTSGTSGLTYQWQSSSDGSTWGDITGATSMTYGATVTVTTFYRAVVTCSLPGGAGAPTPGVELVSNVIPSTISGAGTTCVAASVTLSSTPTGGTWTSGATGVATIGATTGVATGVTAGTTTITYTLATGCRTTSVFTVAPTPSAYTVSPNTSVVCDSGIAQLLTASNSTVPVVATYGTHENVNTTTTYPAPLSMYYGGQRCQFLMLASELAAQGFAAGSSLSAMSLPVTSLGSSYTLNSLQVRVIPSSLSALSTFITTGLVTVKDPVNYAPVVGENNLVFDYPYTWDGTSNIIFDITFGNGITGTTTTAAVQYNSNTSFVSTLVYRADGISAATAASGTTVSFSFSKRPDFILSGTKPIKPTWAPIAGLYTDAAATTPYAGGLTNTVYSLPTAMTVYTTSATNFSCVTTANATVSVNPMPVAITGGTAVCHGLTSTLINTDGGGTWASANTAVATVDATTGVMNGVTPGTALVSYTFTSTGCKRTKVVTVNALPGPITGTAGVCVASTTTLANGDGGGTWGSGSTAIATVGSTGVVTGVSAGKTLITYTLPTTCINTREVTVNPLPTINITPATTTATICDGESTSFTASSPLIEQTILTQDFNGTLTPWTINNLYGGSVNVWQITAAPVSGVAGDGTPMLEAAPIAGGSNDAHTILESPAFSTMGFGTVTLSFNEDLTSYAAFDPIVAVEYSIDNGTSWSVLLDQQGALVNPGTWTASTPQVSINLPTAAVNVPSVKLRWHYESAGVYWNIDNISVKGALPAATFTWAGAGGTSELSCPTCPATTVTPTSTGMNVYSVTASSTCSSTSTVTVNMNPLPNITGDASLLCTGKTITLGTDISGGTWVSGDNTKATVDASTGVVTGVGSGAVVITYTAPTTCIKTVTLNVNQSPSTITGALHVCETLTTALGNFVGGGTWESSDPSVITINTTTGLATGVLAGNSVITYTLPSGCLITSVATVDPTPTAFLGSLEVCEGSVTSLSSSPMGGTWVSSSTGNADVDMTTGVVSGNIAGTATIVYTLATGCERSEDVTVNALPADITGSAEVCEGLTITLANTTTDGTWGSSDLTVATVDAGGVVLGGTAGTAIISYIRNITGCYKTKEVTVNALPGMIGGTLAVCEGLSTTLTNTPVGGTWISSNTSAATIDLASGVMTGVNFGTTNITYTLATGCLRSAEATVNALPDTIAGPREVCEGLTINLANTTPGGTWSSGDLSIAGIDAAGMVTGNLAGTANMFYTLTVTGCLRSVTVTVNQLPTAIGGSLAVCEGLTTSLTNGIPGGTWSSSAAATADVDAVTGVMSGYIAGNATITYTLATGCLKVGDATVNALPATIAGTLDVCKGLTTTLSNTTPGGTWSNDLSGAATVDAAGVVTGATPGTSLITYTISSTGCLKAAIVTVNALPEIYSVTGGGSYCMTTAGIAVGLSNSETDVNYDLYQGGTLMGSVAGTGSAVSFGLQSVIGTYTAFATNSITGCVNDMTGSAIISVTPLNIPAVTLSTAATTVCSGIPVTYTATPVNGGTLPVYDWEINGAPVLGATSATYSYTPSNGDIVKVTLNSNEICAIPSTATDLLTMTVNPSEMPVATISVPTTTICAGSGATFSVAPTFGGTTPTYQWYVNSVATTATGLTYTYVPANGDVVTCKMVSNFTCRLADTVTSNSLVITTTPIVLPIVSLAVSPSSVIISGTTVTFSAIISGIAATVTPAYQWLVNDSVIVGATSSTYTSSTLHNNDSVTCRVNISDPCGFENFNSIVVRVKTVGVSQVFGQGNVMLVPNPNQGAFTVKGKLATEADEEVFVEVLDMLGQTVYKGKTIAKNGALNEQVRLSNTLANGMYMLNLRTATEAAVFHFVLEQ